MADTNFRPLDNYSFRERPANACNIVCYEVGTKETRCARSVSVTGVWRGEKEKRARYRGKVGRDMKMKNKVGTCVTDRPHV